MSISSFNSLFEVSIALHLAYALIRDVHDYHIRKIEDVANSASVVAGSPPEGKDVQRLNIAIRSLRSAIGDRRRRIEAPTLRKQKFCVLVSVFSTAILVLSGIRPDLVLSNYATVGLLSFALLPMPVCCWHSFLTHRWWREGIEEKIVELFSAWSDVIGLNRNIYGLR
jgi:hypothetical protein